jgi:tetratricopeptide (TPR) repeat protein
MTRPSLLRVACVGLLTVALLGTSLPALAQGIGSVRGKIVDAEGKPVPEADIVMEFVGDVQIQVTFKTNTRGEFVRSGLRTGTWKLEARKGDFIGRNNSVQVTISNMTQLEPVTLRTAAELASSAPSGMTAEEVDARNKLMEAMKAEFEGGMAIISTDPAGAVAKFTAVAEKVPGCGVCYTRIGDAHVNAKDDAAAEAAYLKAIEVDEKGPEAYQALANLYNRQQKFAEAAKMGAKAAELAGASNPAGGGGGNAADVLNLGIISWNAGNYPEAKGHFERAVKLDPKLADAHFRLGMAYVNLGQLPEAIKAFEEYIKLAPEGEHAEMSKSLLKSLKGGTSSPLL